MGVSMWGISKPSSRDAYVDDLESRLQLLEYEHQRRKKSKKKDALTRYGESMLGEVKSRPWEF